MAIARSEESAKYKIRHTKYSDLKLLEARNVLDILFTAGDEFSRQVDELCQTTITDSQFERFLDSLVPVPSDEGKGRTMALNTRDAIDGLYRSGDERVAQWHGTAFGVYQTVNTYSQHMQGTDDRRIVRNLNNMVTGKVQDTDANVLKLLAAV
jgi:hypothetical protein